MPRGEPAKKATKSIRPIVMVVAQDPDMPGDVILVKDRRTHKWRLPQCGLHSQEDAYEAASTATVDEIGYIPKNMKVRCYLQQGKVLKYVVYTVELLLHTHLRGTLDAVQVSYLSLLRIISGLDPEIKLENPLLLAQAVSATNQGTYQIKGGK